MSNVFVFRQPPSGFNSEYFGGGGKGGTTTQSVSIPPEVLARYNAVNARAEDTAKQPFQQYGGEFVAGLNPTQQAGVAATNTASAQAQPYFNAATQQLGQAQQTGQNYLGAATGQLFGAHQAAQPFLGGATMAALAGGQSVDPGQLQTQQYINPYVQNVVGATQAAMNQQQGQQLAQQQAEAIKAGAFGGDRSGLQRQALRGQQNLAQAQVIAPLYSQGYSQALQTAQQQQGVGLGAAQANRQALQQMGTQLSGLGQQQFGMGQGVAQGLAGFGQQGYTQGAGTAQQLAGLGTGAQGAALQGAQAQMAAGQVGQQTQQAEDTAKYQQFLQERGYPFQVSQFLANIAMGTGALSGSTTSTTQPGGFFSDKRLKNDVKEIGETHDGQPIYSYKYNGDDRTQIGLMAQDVEKKHPEAVGLMGGYKTVDYKKATEDAERTHKDMGGGLMPDSFDTSSMGGAVMPSTSGEGFMRGGYVGGGLVGNDDWAQIIAANKAALGVYGGAQPMGGAIGAGGIVPQTSIPTPKLVTAGSLPQQRPSGKDIAMQTGKDIAGAYTGGKGLLLGSAADKSAGLIGGGGSTSGKSLFGEAGDWLKDKFADGGLVPRYAYADGGMSEGEEAIPYDPSDVMGNRDPMEGVLKAGTQKHDMLKPASAPGGSGGSGLGDVASILGSAAKIGSFFLKDGGLVPRQGYAGDQGKSGAVLPDDISAQATDVPVDQPPIDDRLDRTLGALKRIESGGKYDITGPASRTGDKPYGAYQVMGANIPSWTEAALGRRMTPDEFLKDQNAQDATAKHRAGLYLNQYDDPRQVASMWLSGKPMEKAGNVADTLGTTVPKYVSMFDRYYGGQDLAPDGKQATDLKPPMDIGRTAPTEGKRSLGDIVTSEGFVVPALGFLGSMLASDKRNLGQALGEGIVGGVGAYQQQRKMLPEIAKKEAETELEKARTGEVQQTTKNLRSGMYVVSFNALGELQLYDKENPTSPPVKLTDEFGKPLPGKEGLAEEAKKMAGAPGTPSGRYVSDPTKLAEKPSDVNKWAPTLSMPENYIPKNVSQSLKVNPATGVAPASAIQITKDAQDRVTGMEAKASSAQDARLELTKLIQQFDAIPQGGWTEFGPGNAKRNEILGRVNGLLGVLGAEKIDASSQAFNEAAKKGTFGLGTKVANSIGTREPGYVVSQAIQSQPGTEMSRKGIDIVTASMLAQNDYDQDKAKFFRDYVSRFHTLEGADGAFEHFNPVQMYANRGLVNSISQEDKQKLVGFLGQYGSQYPGKAQQAVQAFEREHGLGTAKLVLGK